MNRSIVFTREFEKDCRSIPKQVKAQADAVLFVLQSNPVDFGLSVKKLTNVHPPVWRVRVGSFRLLYTFDETQIVLLKFRHRKDVYKGF